MKSSNGDAIADICGRLGVPATGQQIGALASYLALLQRWNAAYNLTAVRDPRTMQSHHLADCIAVVEPMRRQAVAGRVLDVGSGGGLPGVVIAALMPDVEVTSVDAVGKKAAFVRQVGGVLPLPNLRALHGRVERIVDDRGFDLVVSRAFAALPDFVRLTRRLLNEAGRWMAMKGVRPDAEIEGLPSSVEVFHVERLVVPQLEADRCLIWMRPVQTARV